MRKLNRLRNAGFTLVEMILVTSILAIVVVMAFPDFVGFFRLQKEASENNKMKEIQNALSLYAEQNGTLPLAANWARDIASFSHLSENGILTDTYGRTRVYASYIAVGGDVISFKDTDIAGEYAVVYSLGQDRCLGRRDNCANDAAMQVAIDASLTDVADYEVFAAAGEDAMVKYTNLPVLIRNYEVTSERLQDIADLLSTYAETRFAENYGAVSASYFIYYPPTVNSWPAADGSGPDTKDDLYASTVVGDGVTFLLNDEVSDGADDARYDDMRALMRLLGLPESHCCDAMEKVDHDTNAGTPDVDRPFFYYSNPMARDGVGGCLSRPGLTDRKLPPRIRLDSDICG